VATNVYVDGFNLFHGCISGTPLKWLDPRLLAEQLLRGYQIGTVKYFTARVEDRPGDPHQSQRQDTYLQALGTLPQLEIHLGHFKTRTKRVRLLRQRPNGDLFDDARVTEEKGSDVKLAAHLVWDACHRKMDSALVLSNDSDLQEALDMAMRLGVEVIVANPHRHKGQADHLQGDDRRNIRRAHLVRSQLPDPVHVGGRRIRKPPTWA
jgi:uncharacterized LabA/DUF88 family protein